MAMETFQFEKLDQIDDGSVVKGINQALKAAFLDCEERPELKKPRKISLEIGVTPVMEKGEFRYAKVAMTIKSTVPAKGIEVTMRPSSKDAALEFQPSCPDNPDQKPLFEKGGEE